MKNRKVLCILMVFAVAASVLTGCGQLSKAQGAASSAAASSQISSSSQDEESSSSSSAQSEDPASSAVVPVQPNQPTSSQSGPVITIETDDKAFNTKFAANPIDKAYIKESNKAISNVDMVNVSNKYSDIWQKEITNAYSELKKKMETDSSQKPKLLQQEQEDWLKDKTAALKKTSDEAQAAGGSMAQVNVASKVMDFYRSRAAQLYKELFAYDKNYTYAYKGN
jgi:uncharacterized protein YecT (DUF1311 family)